MSSYFPLLKCVSLFNHCQSFSLWGRTSGINGANWHHGKQQKIGLGKENAGFGDTIRSSGSRVGKCTNMLGSERPRGTEYMCC